MSKISGFGFAGIGLLLLAVAPALTDTGPTISGNIDVNVITGNITNTAIGSGSTASVEIGSIINGNINGLVTIVVQTGDIVNSAEGNDSVSMVRVGNIGQ